MEKHQEFTFDKKGTLTDYKTIYTLEKGVTDKQKQEAVDTLTGGNFSASISEHTIVVDGKGNYLGFPYAESKLTESKKRLDEKGTEYNLGSIGKVKVPSGDKKSGGAADINTVAGRLSKAGLKLDAIKPDTFAEASIYGMDKDGIVMYLTNPKGKLGEAMMKPMVMKVIEATAAVTHAIVNIGLFTMAWVSLSRLISVNQTGMPGTSSRNGAIKKMANGLRQLLELCPQRNLKGKTNMLGK